MTYISTKTYGHEIGLSACFRQWRAASHCRFLHGYALKVRLEFEAEELDNKNWVLNFGGLKSFKSLLEETFDHKLLVARDDPMAFEFLRLEQSEIADVIMVEATGCEAFAKMIFEAAEIWLVDNGYGPRVKMRSVEVSEHGANSAIYIPTKEHG
jgi:6-pyruvoyltetrahydropterin/6-carboxytetrahydropterin synthase